VEAGVTSSEVAVNAVFQVHVEYSFSDALDAGSFALGLAKANNVPRSDVQVTVAPRRRLSTVNEFVARRLGGVLAKGIISVAFTDTAKVAEVTANAKSTVALGMAVAPYVGYEMSIPTMVAEPKFSVYLETHVTSSSAIASTLTTDMLTQVASHMGLTVTSVGTTSAPPTPTPTTTTPPIMDGEIGDRKPTAGTTIGSYSYVVLGAVLSLLVLQM